MVTTLILLCYSKLIIVYRDNLKSIIDSNNKKEVLGREEMEMLKEKIELAVKGAAQTRQGGRGCITKGVSPYRTQYLSFLRCCWNKLPNIRSLKNYVNYECAKNEDGSKEGYEEVVTVVANIVHEFLFFGLDKITFFGYTDAVVLSSRKGLL